MADDELNRVRERMDDLSDVVQSAVTNQASMSSDVKHLIESFREHRDDSKVFMRETVTKLQKIEEQTTKTNGRVDRLEDRERTRTGGHHEQRRSTDKGNAITINVPINKQTIMAIIAATVAIAMAGWKAGLFS